MPKTNRNLSAKTPKPFRLSDRTVGQIRELVDGGYCTNDTAAVTEAVNSLYYHRVESANEISLASRKVAEQPVSPEIVEIDGELWLNLGSGLLAEAAAAMLVAQFPDDARAQQNAIDEWLIWHRAAGQDAYNAFRCIIMFRF